jgi:hypothetical protein
VGAAARRAATAKEGLSTCVADALALVTVGPPCQTGEASTRRPRCAPTALDRLDVLHFPANQAGVWRKRRVDPVAVLRTGPATLAE